MAGRKRKLDPANYVPAKWSSTSDSEYDIPLSVPLPKKFIGPIDSSANSSSCNPSESEKERDEEARFENDDVIEMSDNDDVIEMSENDDIRDILENVSDSNNQEAEEDFPEELLADRLHSHSESEHDSEEEPPEIEEPDESEEEEEEEQEEEEVESIPVEGIIFKKLLIILINLVIPCIHSFS